MRRKKEIFVGSAAEPEHHCAEFSSAPALLTLNEAFRALGVGRTKGHELLREALTNGGLEAVRLGARRMIVAESLRNYIATLPRVKAS